MQVSIKCNYTPGGEVTYFFSALHIYSKDFSEINLLINFHCMWTQQIVCHIYIYFKPYSQGHRFSTTSVFSMF